MINLKLLIGNNHIKEIVKQHFFHAYIIDGAEGSGKHTLSGLLTQAMICSAEEKPCGRCKQCEKFISGNHPDIIRIDGDSKIAEMREYLSSVNLAPNDGDKKIYIIDNADKLAPLAQNTLLKPLEEPLKHVVFILIAATKESLLETVRSRCVCLTMSPVVDEDIIKYLKNKYPGIEESKLKEAVFLSGGYIGKAVKYIEAERNQLFETCENFYKALKDKNYSAIMDIVSFKQRNELEDFVSSMKTYFQKKLHSAVKENAYEQKNDDIKKLLALCSVFEDIETKLDYNINLNLWSTYIIKQCKEQNL